MSKIIQKVFVFGLLSFITLPATYATQMEIQPKSVSLDSRASFEKAVGGDYFGDVSLEQLIGASSIQMLEGKEYTSLQIDGALMGHSEGSVSIQFFPQGPTHTVQIDRSSRNIEFNNLNSYVHRNSLRLARVYFSSVFYVEKVIIRFEDRQPPIPEYSYQQNINRTLNFGEILTVGYWGVPELQGCAVKKFAVFVGSPVGIVDYAFMFNFGSSPRYRAPYARAYLNTRSAWEIAGPVGGILGVTTPYDSFSIEATAGPLHVQHVVVTCRR